MDTHMRMLLDIQKITKEVWAFFLNVLFVTISILLQLSANNIPNMNEGGCEPAGR